MLDSPPGPRISRPRPLPRSARPDRNRHRNRRGRIELETWLAARPRVCSIARRRRLYAPGWWTSVRDSGAQDPPPGGFVSEANETHVIHRAASDLALESAAAVVPPCS